MKLSTGGLVPLLVLLATAPALAGPPAARRDDSGKPGPIERALDVFSKSRKGDAAEKAYAAVIARVEEAVPAVVEDSADADPWWRGVRALALELAVPEPAPSARYKSQTAKRSASPAEARAYPLPREIQYRFGHRDLLVLDTADKVLVRKVKGGESLAPADLPPIARLEQLLYGGAPGAELALAEIQRRLDVHHGFDRFSQFLDAWRNGGPDGDESFYEALDRTAGTDDAVFFYDAMLADFVGKFVGDEGKTWSLQQQHSRHQQSFLSLRQYRGFIEASAYALTSPPTVALPKRLARYDYGAFDAGMLSLRDQIDVLLEGSHGDPRPVVDFLAGFIERHPLPDKPWEGYELAAAFSDEFKTAVVALVEERKEKTEDLAALRREHAGALARSVSEAAAAALAAP